MNLGKLTEEEKQEVREQINQYHKYAELIQKGRYYRLTNPFVDEAGAWEVVSEDGKEALLNVVMLEKHGNMTVKYVQLCGLDENALYKEEAGGKVYSGSALMEAGIPLPVEMGEYLAYQYYFSRIEI